jgi:hypothetical protein
MFLGPEDFVCAANASRALALWLEDTLAAGKRAQDTSPTLERQVVMDFLGGFAMVCTMVAEEFENTPAEWDRRKTGEVLTNATHHLGNLIMMACNG